MAIRIIAAYHDLSYDVECYVVLQFQAGLPSLIDRIVDQLIEA